MQMAKKTPQVSVIIGTLAEARRRDALLRAIDSILKQEDIVVLPIVVANGKRFDPQVMADLRARNDIRFDYEELGSLPNALRVGRQLVDTPFFCFLDDDDEYFPHALRSRVDVLLANDDIDAVIGNGFRMNRGVREESAANINEARDAPFRSMIENNWLTPCGGMYRSATIGADYFDNIPKYGEWTYVAYKLCVTGKLAFLDNPGYMMADTEGSLSKSLEYDHAQVDILDRILELPLPLDARQLVQEKRGAALHDLSALYLSTGKFGPAWKNHLKSLLQPRGFRYFLFTRRLFGL